MFLGVGSMPAWGWGAQAGALATEVSPAEAGSDSPNPPHPGLTPGAKGLSRARRAAAFRERASKLQHIWTCNKQLENLIDWPILRYFKASRATRAAA